MGIYLNPGNDNFKRALRSHIYVDKTGLLSYINSVLDTDEGYIFENGLHIYNPKSVVDSIRKKRITNYWTRTETYESLRNYISMNFDGLKDDIICMLTGGRCKVNPNKFQNDMVSFQSKDDILTLLIHLGYLAYDMNQTEAYIPNEEIRSEFKNAVEDTGWDFVMIKGENTPVPHCICE